MIRLKVFIPVFVLVSLILWFAIYRLDAWLKNTMEDSISLVTGTRTNIQDLRLSFKNSSVIIKKLQIASSREEFKNAVEFSDIVIDFQSLPLLEKRVVIDDFSVKGIAWDTPRRTSGFLPPKPKDEKPSWFSEWAGEAMDVVKREFEELPVARLGDFRVPSNANEILDELKLESEVAFKETLVELQKSRTAWSERVKELRDISEYKAFAEEVRALTNSVPQDPRAILARVEDAQRSLNFFKDQKQKAETLVGDVKTEYRKMELMYKAAEAAIQKDYERAKSLVSLDQFDLKNLSKVLFGPQWLERAELVLHYHALIRRFANRLKPQEEESIEIRQRARGRDIIFVSPKKKPSFLLSSSEFTVTGFEKDNANQVSQTYELKLADLNSAPKLHGKPTKLDLLARFRNWEISEANLNLFWDYTQETAVDTYRLGVKNIEAANWPVGIPRVFPIRIGAGVAESKTELRFVGDQLSWKNRIDFEKVEWDLKDVPQVGLIVPTLVRLFKDISKFFLEIEFLRKDGKFGMVVKSDLDNQMNRSIQAVIQEKWKEFQEKLKRELQAKIRVVRTEAERELKEYSEVLVAGLDQKLNMAKEYQAQAERKIEELKAKAKKAAEDQAKSAVQDQLEKAKEIAPKPKIKLPF